MKNIVAIVGRPNVGKSTLFNRICRKRLAIVDAQEGITRDRLYQETYWAGISFIVVDTGGIIPKAEDEIDKAVKFQAEIAMEEADVVIFLVDAKVGTTDLDLEVARILSPHREKIILAANKVDNEKDQLEIYDFLQLGFGEAFPLAAIHGRNVGNFLDIVISRLKQIPVVNEAEDAIKVAIVGKPNVGKSSIVNKLTGSETNIVTTVPGTTRDAIDTSIRHFGQKITIIDTAGLRRKKRIKYGVEYFSSMRTIESINRAQVVLLIIDATEVVSTQDQKIASYAHRNFKDIVIVINKWDLIEKDNSSVGKFISDLNRELPFLQYAPKIFVSALTGQRIRQILDIIMEVEAESRKRIPTAELNKFLSRATGHFAPSHSSGKHSKIYYCTQVKSAPPTFVFFCNNPALITKQYRKYLENQLREQFKFQGVPLRVFFRGRDADDSDL